MKTREVLRTVLGLLAVTVIGGSVKAQWIPGGGGRQYLTNPTEGVRVGFTTTSPPSALTVNGDEMSTPTGEVFRTVAPANASTSWRLLRDSIEYGRIYNFANSTFLNIGARAGGMRLYTLNVERFRLLGNATPYTIGSFTGQQKNGSLLLSPNVGNFFSNGGPGPYSMLHLAAV